MIIDFHTHVFPDSIADATLKALSTSGSVTPCIGGTVSALLSSMDAAGVNKSVILPVNTRKGQFESITRFAEHINDTYDELISFGGIHPDDDDIEEKLSYLKNRGFKGVKIHPDYTRTYINDERYIRIIAECHRQGLLVITHAGYDPSYTDVHCQPKMALDMLNKVNSISPYEEPFIIIAHLGGNRLLSDVERYLVGQNCYLDISCSFRDLGKFSDSSDEDIVRVIKNHGADRVLFATDSPWNDPKAYIDRVRSLNGLTDNEKELILGKNAERLLKL